MTKQWNNQTNMKFGLKCRIIVLISYASFRQPDYGSTVKEPSLPLLRSRIFIAILSSSTIDTERKL